MKITILGCGPSGGVPLVTGSWGKCNPNNPKNHRTRTSIAINIRDETWVVDMSPDLRAQCLREKISRIDGILCTHAHFDHISGLEELKPFAVERGVIPIYADPETLAILVYRSPYAFESEEMLPAIYKRFLKTVEITGTFSIAGVPVIPFEQDHRYSKSIGFRFPFWAYSTDVWELDENALDLLAGIDLWIVDCLDFVERDTHAHLDKTLAWIDRIKPNRAILTHMGIKLDYDELSQKLPDGVIPAHDGLALDVPD